ncbi:asparaginase [Cognatishimia sp. F0-27]|uniref:asparaginase n=1 Tax=Cognatishimia sp. F0-27 TaxID=2816855 RepID=UPI001D0C4137|nr:asparaginase [Cognatishimia sp. F0-27]MCC1491267.1 asparaginase [Cognatishimia sp. F0-27]
MTQRAAPMVEIHRGPFVESLHCGHAVLWDRSAGMVEAWGDPGAICLPRSAIKMIQALPLVASGAADAAGLTLRHLALACASHEGAPMHVGLVREWLADQELDERALVCGPQMSRDRDLKLQMIRAGESGERVHNNCSGKHVGFLTLARHLGADLDYCDPSHPVQVGVLEMFNALTDETSPGFGIDGCSAPNHAASIAGIARAMAFFASAHKRDNKRSLGAALLVKAMATHPELVAGKGRACTLLMRAAREPLVVKTGAEGFFIAILPKRQQGIALKIADGATRASNCAIAALLVRMGALEADHPDVARFLKPEIRNWDGKVTGHMAPVAGLI